MCSKTRRSKVSQCDTDMASQTLTIPCQNKDTTHEHGDVISGGGLKPAVQKLAAAGKRAVFAMQQRCADLGIQDIALHLVARHMNVCFQARKQYTQSDESQRAPYPGR